MDKYAIVTTAEIPGRRGKPGVPANTVVNVIVWDGDTPYDPGANRALVRSDTLQIGDSVP